jgi:hypothetical protein
MSLALFALLAALPLLEAAAARPDLGRRLEHALGYKRMPWPPKPNGRVVGTVRRSGYRIGKVVFDSLPGVAVPGHLYLPEGATPRVPAILYYNGHWSDASKALPDHQAFAIHMGAQRLRGVQL